MQMILQKSEASMNAFPVVVIFPLKELQCFVPYCKVFSVQRMSKFLRLVLFLAIHMVL